MDKVMVIFSLIIVFLILNLIQLWVTEEYETNIGEVTNVDFKDDYMVVTFDNGDVYNINYHLAHTEEIDLTVNSKMRIELRKQSCFIFPNNDNRWDIITITKVPDGVIE